MSNSFLFPVRSVESVNFIEALAQNAASAMNNLGGLPPGVRQFIIRAAEVTALEHFGPTVNVFRTALGLTVDPGTDQCAGIIDLSSLGLQIGATGLWRFYKDGLAIPYVDLDTVGQSALNPTLVPAVHVILGNNAATAKTVGAVGNTVVTLWVEPQQSF